MLVLVLVIIAVPKPIPDQQVLFANRWNEMMERDGRLKGIRMSVRKADALQVSCETADLCAPAYASFGMIYRRMEGFEAAGFTEVDFASDDNALPKELRVMKLVEMDRLLNSK